MTFLPLSDFNFLFGPIEDAVIFGGELVVGETVEAVVDLILKCNKCVCCEAQLSGLTDTVELSRWTLAASG